MAPADEVQYWEETRLHPAQVATPAASAAAAATTLTLNLPTNTQKPLRVNDVILIGGQDRFIVTAVAGAPRRPTLLLLRLLLFPCLLLV